jgi:hypothetical protein
VPLRCRIARPCQDERVEVASYVESISREAAFDTRFKAGESEVRVLT